MSDTVRQFYDDMAQDYAFIFPDWEQTTSRQGRVLATILIETGIERDSALLDCTCGIGTQALGLAQQGFRVHGTDLSPEAIATAKSYVPRFDFKYVPTFAVADLLKPDVPARTYPVVIACDNAIAHFHSETDLLKALKTMIDQLDAGGLLLLSLRDYDALMADPPRTTPVRINDNGTHRVLVFQTWDWDEGFSAYRLEMFFLTQAVQGWQTRSMVSHLRAWLRVDVEHALIESGLHDIQWLMPADSGYYQPIVIARKSG